MPCSPASLSCPTIDRKITRAPSGPGVEFIAENDGSPHWRQQIGLSQILNPAGTLFRLPLAHFVSAVATSFKAWTGRLIRAWNSRILGTISLRKREPLNTP